MWLVFILIAQLAGIIGSFFTASSVDNWYLQINKPSFNPPGMVFGPVWITLFTLMGIASYLIWQQRGDDQRVKTALVIYGVHLVFNILWSVLFFGLKNPQWAFVEILVLLLLIILTMVKFYQIKPLAMYLLIPYLLWTSFASFLNFTIWRLN